MDEPADPVTVVIVDDHAVVRQGVRVFLASQPGLAVVGEAATGESALRLAADLAPDVALVDLVMPGIDGVETTRRLKEVSPRTRVAVLTSYHDDEHALPALRAGALSYVLKDVQPAELARAVRGTARGGGVVDPRVAARLLRELRGEAPDAGPAARLGGREVEVLRSLAAGLSNAEIAERLAIGQKTVKSHVSNILGKLHLQDRTQAAVYAWRTGMVTPSETGRHASG